MLDYSKFERCEYNGTPGPRITRHAVEIYCHAFRILPYVAIFHMKSPTDCCPSMLKTYGKEVDAHLQSLTAAALFLSACDFADNGGEHLEAARIICDIENTDEAFSRPRGQTLQCLDYALIGEAKKWQEAMIREAMENIEIDKELDNGGPRTLDDEIRAIIQSDEYGESKYMRARFPTDYFPPKVWQVTSSYLGVERITRDTYDHVVDVIREFTY
jgi:hypothetical protein